MSTNSYFSRNPGRDYASIPFNRHSLHSSDINRDSTRTFAISIRVNKREGELPWTAESGNTVLHQSSTLVCGFLFLYIIVRGKLLAAREASLPIKYTITNNMSFC